MVYLPSVKHIVFYVELIRNNYLCHYKEINFFKKISMYIYVCMHIYISI